MEIIIGKTAGFCFGVANAVKKTKKELENRKEIYCLGELVHNNQVINDLQNQGLKIIEDIYEAKGSIIIRAHGERQEIYKKAKDNNLNIIDLTCPKVLKMHDIAKEYSENGYYIFLIGKESHPEIKATISYCGNYSTIIENEDEINNAVNKFNDSNLNKLLIIVQTTFNLEKYENIIKLIRESLKDNINISLEIINTICDATRLRQEETKDISSKVDLMIIIGGKNSSNTNKLYEISKENCKCSILIEDVNEINIENVKKYKKIGIMAGASTPKKSVDSVVEMLKKL